MPPQDERTRGYDIVLTTRNRWDVVIGRTSVEIASFAAKRDESPYVNVDAGAEIEDAAGELPRRRVGTPIDLRQALFIVGISAANHRVR